VKILRELARETDRPLVVAIGFFDGLHRGHRRLIDRMRAMRKPGWRSGVLTFENHPSAFLRPGSEPSLICTLEERLRLFDAAGVEECVMVPFDAAVAQLSPDAFVNEILVGRLGVRGAVVGSTFRFGHKRAGDAQTMAQLCAQRGVAFDALENLTESGERISSTRIRGLIAGGETLQADGLMDAAYEIRGRVERGAGRGALLGFPTANVTVPKKLLPRDGVYSAIARLDGRDYAALVSIGTNPTFGDGARTVEAWLRDFHHTIYGCELALRDFRFVRDQRTFASPDELMAQMRSDAEAVAYPSYG
jgi:riboflavin kinase/FMN adenylyltransferase